MVFKVEENKVEELKVEELKVEEVKVEGKDPLSCTLRVTAKNWVQFTAVSVTGYSYNGQFVSEQSGQNVSYARQLIVLYNGQSGR